MFKKLAIVAVVLGGGLIVGEVAQAQGFHHHDYRRSSRDHDRFHDYLDHNAFHRQLEHREAHRYPMTPWQHGRLHDNLSHDRYHDQLDHREYHRSHVPTYHHSRYPYIYNRGGFGIGITPYGFSLRIGR